MNSNLNDVIAILKKLVSINSCVSRSNYEIILYIQSILKKFSPRIYHFKKGGLDLYNLIVKIKGEGSARPLVFFMHTDTVEANGRWTCNPFKLIVRKDKIHGLGASDMKSSLASVISALLNLKKKPKRDIIIVFDSDEEGELVGGKQALNQLRKRNLAGATIIVPEATSGKVFLGHRACIDLKITCCGRAGHSARTSLDNNLRNNAIYKAVGIMNKLIDDEGRLQKQKDRNLGASVQSIGIINGGTGVNVVADKCYFLMTRRLLPKVDLDKEYKQLISLIRGANGKVRIDTLFKEKGFQIKKDDFFVKTVSRAVKNNLDQVEYGYLNGWAESGFLQEMGNCLIIGPGIEGQGHQSDEYASLALLNKFTKIWQELILFS